MENQIAQFDKLKADITMYIAPAKSIVVADKDTQMVAMSSVKEVVTWKKKVEEKRKELIAPLLEAQKEINDYAKKITEPLVGAETHLKSQLIEWDKKLEAKRQEEMKRIQAERQIKEKEALEAAKKAKEEAEAAAMFESSDDAIRSNLVVEAEAERKTIEIAKETRKEEKAVMENKVSGIREVWKFEVTDPLVVPREFLLVDESAIGRLVRGGTREIPGVRIYSEKTMGVR